MKTFTLKQAVEQIATLLDEAFSGEEIIIKKNDRESIRISPIRVQQRRPPLWGSDKDIIWIADNFDEPLAEFEDYL